MVQKLLDLLVANSLYVVVGLVVLALLMTNKKVRKNVGALIFPLILLVAVAVGYQLIMQKGSSRDSQAVFDHEEKGSGLSERKSIYYTDPDEKLREGGAATD